MDVHERVARLEERADALQEDVRELRLDVHGPLQGRSVRERIHKLETNDAAAMAAAAALDAAKRIRQDTWSSWSKWVVTGAAVASAVLSLYAAAWGG